MIGRIRQLCQGSGDKDAEARDKKQTKTPMDTTNRRTVVVSNVDRDDDGAALLKYVRVSGCVCVCGRCVLESEVCIKIPSSTDLAYRESGSSMSKHVVCE